MPANREIGIEIETVIPAQAGIQPHGRLPLDPRLRGNDKLGVPRIARGFQGWLKFR